MTISMPLVTLLGAGVFLAWRYMGLRVWHVVLCLLFGFFLSATNAAPDIRHIVATVVRWFTRSY